MRRVFGVAAATLVLAAGAWWAPPAGADHTDPSKQTPGLLPTNLPATPVYVQGNWKVIKSFGANPGTDLEFFTRGGEVFASSGTLGGGNAGHVGQRITRLVDGEGNVNPAFVADHGSAACEPNPAGTTGLQHDVQVTPPRDPELLVDASDATGRCHDPAGGGMELVDISGVGRAGGAPVREVHLVRFDGFSHNITVDPHRPWLVYNSTSDLDRPWIDVVDIRSCLGVRDAPLADKRERCRPRVYRIPFEPTWTAQIEPATKQLMNPYGCHDITATGGRLFCAAVHGTAVFDVEDITDAAGNVRGAPLPCTVLKGTRTAAAVTDCTVTAAAHKEAGAPKAEGWRFLGSVNHPGINYVGPRATNNQLLVPSDEGVSVSHEADPTPDGKYMFVTDERGGGLVPPGASCLNGNVDNPVGNGGLHVFDITDPAKPKYALRPDGKKAVWITDATVPAATFCNIHLIEHVPGEHRLVVAYYSQGVKFVDYKIDEQGRFTFTEVGALMLPGAATWAAEPFKIVDNPDGTRTYFVMTSDVGRGIDIVSFTARPNPIPAPAAERAAAASDPQPRGGQLPATGEASEGRALLALTAALGAAVLLLRVTRRSRSCATV